MYTESPGKDAVLFAKAIISNQLAKLSPKLYVKLTHRSGRGREEDNPQQIAQYFVECIRDYQVKLGLNEAGFRKYIEGKSVLEYGPGDILGVPLLMYAYGAKKVDCVDRFPLSNLSYKNIQVYNKIMDCLDKGERGRACSAFKEKGNPASGIRSEAINYSVTGDGLSEFDEKYDLIISRAVLEHVNNLEATIRDIERNMIHGGISIHKVDLRSHGLDRYTDYDFLTWPQAIYNIMYSNKGFPNRWRIDKYREYAEHLNLQIKSFIRVGYLEPEKIDIIYHKIAPEFRHMTKEQLSWRGFWIILEHR